MTATPARPPMGSVTRHLCIGVHLDRWFRNRVLDQVYYRHDRAIAPNPGVQVEQVLHHALRARQDDAGQQAVLAVAALLLLVPTMLDGPLLFWVLLGWSLLVFVVVSIRSGLESPSTQRKLKLTQILRPDPLQQSVIGGIFGLAVLGAIAAALHTAQTETTSVWNTATGRYELVAEAPPGPDMAAAWVWGAVLVLICLVFGALKAQRFRTIDETGVILGPDRRAKKIAAHADGSRVITHSADELPFVGSGHEITTWQFALALHPNEVDGGEKGEVSLKDLRAAPLIEQVREAIKALGSPDMGRRRIPDLRVEDQVFVSGQEAQEPVYRMRDLGKAGTRLRSVQDVQEDPTSSVRHYLRCEVSSWDGELITSVFVHCALQGDTLFVEFSSFLLPPTRAEYQMNPRSAAFGDDAVILGAFKGAALTPIALGRSVFDTAVYIVRGMVNSMRVDVGGQVNATGDCGARTSIRQLGTGDRENNYFQYRDSVKYTEILERQILQTITVFLREAGIDTAELGERVTAIVNYGVINYGQLTAGAAGAGSSANIGSVGNGSRGTMNGVSL